MNRHAIPTISEIIERGFSLIKRINADYIKGKVLPAF